MSIEVIYQGLTIAKGPSFRLQDGGLFIEVDGPMPVATALQVRAGEHALQGRVRRVHEGTGSGMLVVPSEGKLLPRWLKTLEVKVVGVVEFEPEPVVIAQPEPVVVAAPVVEPEPAAVPVVTEPLVAAAVEATEPTVEAKADDSKPAEAKVDGAASRRTPSEGADGSATDEEDDDKAAGKGGDKKAPTAKAAKKKPRKR